jgi:carbon storage regulator CsrA
MLVLSRRVGEEIIVPGCNLTFRVLAVRGQRVRLGISAPPQVPILRGELAAAAEPDPPREGRPSDR